MPGRFFFFRIFSFGVLASAGDSKETNSSAEVRAGAWYGDSFASLNEVLYFLANEAEAVIVVPKNGRLVVSIR